MLARVLAMFDDNREKAAKFCIRVAILFPQFADEFNGYADALLRRAQS